ncbi:hypothetical protein CsSME_00051013 [Camellia sinensis var. sinensis]
MAVLKELLPLTKSSDTTNYDATKAEPSDWLRKRWIIRMVMMPINPLELPKFKHKKRVPKDQQDWKIPPCISNWKSPKGFTIPLDRRLAADGRGLQEVQTNDNLSESLYVVEQKAREDVAMRSKVQKERDDDEAERKERA